MPKLDIKLINNFRDSINSGGRILKLYRDIDGKNKYNIICSAMDWIQVSVGGIDTGFLLRNNTDEASRHLLYFVSLIDVMVESVTQLHRVLFNTDEVPFSDDRSVFNKAESDNQHFKTIRAIFAAHPVNLKRVFPDEPAGRYYASWSGAGFGHGDFSAIIYSNIPGKDHTFFDISFDELFKFAKKRYEHLHDLITEVGKQIGLDNQKWMRTKIPERGLNVLEHIDLLLAENEKRLENDWAKYRLEWMKAVFSTQITDSHNREQAMIYQDALIGELDYIHECLQIMRFDDEFDEVKGDCPPELIYQHAKIVEMDYSLFWYSIETMNEYLSDVVNLSKVESQTEAQVLVEAGLWIKTRKHQKT